MEGIVVFAYEAVNALFPEKGEDILFRQLVLLGIAFNGINNHQILLALGFCHADIIP